MSTFFEGLGREYTYKVHADGRVHISSRNDSYNAMFHGLEWEEEWGRVEDLAHIPSVRRQWAIIQAEGQS